jgi:hypothetical protein
MIGQIWRGDERWQRGDFERRFQQCRVSVIEMPGLSVVVHE